MNVLAVLIFIPLVLTALCLAGRASVIGESLRLCAEREEYEEGRTLSARFSLLAILIIALACLLLLDVHLLSDEYPRIPFEWVVIFLALESMVVVAIGRPLPDFDHRLATAT